jgi:hypothetical protein
MTEGTMNRVRDGQRILQFDGKEIGFSTSKRRGAVRWIEFTLYKTDEGGQYVLSRVGFSKLYHLPDCEIAERSRLDESPRGEVEPDDHPCEQCKPDKSNFPFVSFEREKHWARVYSTPEDVIDGLMKVDLKSGNRYMTAVARRLLEDAGQSDDALYEAQSTEIIR